MKKKSLLITTLFSINLFAVDISNVITNYTNSLNEVLQNKNLKALNDLKFTEQDKQFINYSNNLIDSNINAITNDIDGIYMNLNNYSNSIQEGMSKLLEKNLTLNELSLSSYEDQIKSAFSEGFKVEALKEISSLQILNDSQKQQLIDGMNNIKDIVGLKNYFTSQKFDYQVCGDSGCFNQKFVPENLTKKASALQNAQTNTINTFDCACVSPLTNAFKDIQKHIMDDNLNPLYANLTSLDETIKSNIKTAEAQTPLIEKSNQFYAVKILEAQEHLHKLNILLKNEF
jgi:hypothetical protein